MPPVVIEGTLNIRVIWTLANGQEALNVLNADIGAGPSVNQAMATTIAGHVGAAHVSSGLQALQPTTVELDRVDIRDLRTANQPLISATIGQAGTDTSDQLPNGVSLVVTARTALVGRSFRGRTFIPGFSGTARGTDGTATTAAQDAAAGFLDDLNGDMTAEGWPLGVASQTTSPGFITQVTNYVTRNGVWDRQWRRALP